MARFSSLEISKNKNMAYAGRGKRRKEGEMWRLEELTAFSTSPRGDF
jgi:hypothetical protein